MVRKVMIICGVLLLIGIMLTGCAGYYSGYGYYDYPYYDYGDGYYGYPYHQGNELGEENPVIDAHGHHHHR